MTDRPASIEDVAQRAGVSTATVSRVLNSPEKVAAATAERVRDAMAHLDYRPNQFASGLMTRRSGVIGLVLPDGFEGVSIEMIRRADDEAWRLGFHLLLIAESRLREAAEVRGSAALGMLDAVAILSARPPGAVVENAAGLGVPVAAVEPVPTSGASTNPAEPAETAAALVRAAVRLALERR